MNSKWIVYAALVWCVQETSLLLFVTFYTIKIWKIAAVVRVPDIYDMCK